MRVQRVVASAAGALAVSLFAFSGHAQGPVAVSNGGGMKGIQNAPFSATFVTTRVETLADGTQITHVSRIFRARDSEGRTRMEMYGPRRLAQQGADDIPVVVEIIDPVAGERITLNPQQKTARVSAWPAQAVGSAIRAVAPAPGAGAEGGQILAPPSRSASITAAIAVPDAVSTGRGRATMERLGTQTIDGVDAEGTRITRVIPAGAEGNDREITVVTETWRSPELGIVVLQKTTDPRGDSTTEAQDLSRDEPDASLFQAPADYAVTSPDGPETRR